MTTNISTRVKPGAAREVGAGEMSTGDAPASAWRNNYLTADAEDYFGNRRDAVWNRQDAKNAKNFF
jgi:hypothetical protein